MAQCAGGMATSSDHGELNAMHFFDVAKLWRKGCRSLDMKFKRKQFKTSSANKSRHEKNTFSEEQISALRFTLELFCDGARCA